ncbi:MAG: (d)CMP kinase [Lachnospiraceae bacterium]|nr:(d)CMP kinase [Lachnospiraceae bacterium]
MNVAIDGPAGAGKSTIAKLVAKKKGYIYVDTGAMYRAMALYLSRTGLDPKNAESADPAIANATIESIKEKCLEPDISIEYQNGEQVVILNGENVNGLIRTPQVSDMASVSSAVQEVRTRLVALQQKLAAEQDVVMDGRDIGTVVLPKAEVKVYLTASVQERARRRHEELKAKGTECDLATIEAEIAQRDERDMNREASPLKQAEDAVLIDSSHMTIEEVADSILELIEKSGQV